MIAPTHDFLAARAAADEHGLSVCGTYRNGKPIYFLTEPDCPESRLRELAFEAQHGRTMTEEELRLLRLVEAERPESLTASFEDVR